VVVEVSAVADAAARRVLVVEAEAAAVEALAAELRDRGHRVVAIVDAADTASAATVGALAAQAATDPLTGLANRRTLDDDLRAAWSRCVRDGEPLAVLVIDVDHFKAFNDTVGHQAGDACLAAIAGAAQRASARAGSVACRWGGDEFLVVLPATDLTAAAAIADDVLAAVRGLPRHVAAAGDRRLTVSIGVSATLPAAGGDAAVVVAAADRAMYAAKQSGRDRRVAAEA
jgi:diguanylate cyclase (GGDEF)-like protein